MKLMLIKVFAICEFELLIVNLIAVMMCMVSVCSR